MKKSTTIATWIFRVIIFAIMLLMAIGKLTSNPDSIEMFTTLGVESWGRYLVGGLELVAAILIIISPLQVYGAALTAGLMGGAIFSHITKIGFEGPNGVLAGLAVVLMIFSTAILFLQRERLPIIGKLLAAKS